MPRASPGIMCVELAPDQLERRRRAEAFPFILGLGRSRRRRVSWYAVGVRYDPTLLYALDPDTFERLLAVARRELPRVIVLNERLRDDQMAALADAAGGARGVYLSHWEQWIQLFPEFIQQEIPEIGGPLPPDWLSRIAPVFNRKSLGDAPWAVNPLFRIVAGPRCSYRTLVADNPFYRELALPKTMSCSFCYTSSNVNPVKDEVAFAVRQIEAACRQLPETTDERQFEVLGSRIWPRLEEFLMALSRAGVRGVELSFMPRIDQILGARESILRCLPTLAAADLAMRLYGAGIENFSPDENMRFNKGISAEQVHEAAAFIISTRSSWPRQFRFTDGMMSMILFTPWTRLEDLRINVENIERCSLICPFFALGQRLQIFPEPVHPIRLLAERDGLIGASRGNSFYNSGCIVDASQEEIPWRFAHPEVGVLCQLGLAISRFKQSDGRATDPVSRKIGDLLMILPTPLVLFRRAIDEIERRPRTPSLQTLLTALSRAAS